MKYHTQRGVFMKKEKIKEILGKVGKATLPVIMLMSGAWKGNFTALSATELDIRAREQEKKMPAIEMQNNENEKEDFKFLAQCYGCSGSCSGSCRASCVGSCSGSCIGSCHGSCNTTCYGTCTNTCSFTCMGTCSDSCLSYY